MILWYQVLVPRQFHNSSIECSRSIRVRGSVNVRPAQLHWIRNSQHNAKVFARRHSQRTTCECLTCRLCDPGHPAFWMRDPGNKKCQRQIVSILRSITVDHIRLPVDFFQENPRNQQSQPRFLKDDLNQTWLESPENLSMTFLTMSI